MPVNIAAFGCSDLPQADISPNPANGRPLLTFATVA